MNPYAKDLLIYKTADKIAQSYQGHRFSRNKAKRQQLLQDLEVEPDKILSGLVNGEPPESDPRNNITIWVRPEPHVKDLILYLQQELRIITQSDDDSNPLWLMPQECLHMSALEVAHSATPAIIQDLLSRMGPNLPSILDPIPSPLMTQPLLCYDKSAIALTFIPATHDSRGQPQSFTYTHYRAQLFDKVLQSGVVTDSRYQVPSAHITIARFIGPIDVNTIISLTNKLVQLNEWLQLSSQKNLLWQVAQTAGSECRCGRIWYGGGWSEHIGRSIKDLDRTFYNDVGAKYSNNTIGSSVVPGVSPS